MFLLQNGSAFEQGESLVLILLHDFSLSRALVVDAAEVQDAVDDDAMKLIIVGLAKLLDIGTHGIERNHDVAVNHIILIVIEGDDASSTLAVISLPPLSSRASPTSDRRESPC